MSPKLRELGLELGERLWEIEKVVKARTKPGAGWQVALVVGSPERPTESLVLTNMDREQVVALVESAQGGER